LIAWEGEVFVLNFASLSNFLLVVFIHQRNKHRCVFINLQRTVDIIKIQVDEFSGLDEGKGEYL